MWGWGRAVYIFSLVSTAIKRSSAKATITTHGQTNLIGHGGIRSVTRQMSTAQQTTQYLKQRAQMLHQVSSGHIFKTAQIQVSYAQRYPS